MAVDETGVLITQVATGAEKAKAADGKLPTKGKRKRKLGLSSKILHLAPTEINIMLTDEAVANRGTVPTKAKICEKLRYRKDLETLEDGKDP